MKISPPHNWTNDAEQLETDWAYPDSHGQAFAEYHGLNSPKPIMCSTNDSGECLHLFLSGSSYYIWNQIEHNVWRIEEPSVLEEIVSKIDEGGVVSLKVKRMHAA